MFGPKVNFVKRRTSEMNEELGITSMPGWKSKGGNMGEEVDELTGQSGVFIGL